MHKLDIQPHNTSFAVTLPPPGSHLIVLVPEIVSDPMNEARRIWELARATGTNVLLLGLCSDAALESDLRRRLVTLSALVQEGRISSDAKIESGTNWVEAVRHNYQTGDLIACFAGQHAGLWHRPLSQILESNLKIPVHIFSSLDLQKFKTDWLSQAAGWSGSIGIIVGFGILQAKIVQLPDDWFQSLLLILSIIPEFWLIWVWNNLFG